MKKLIKFFISVFFLIIFCSFFVFLIIGLKGFYAPSWALSKFEKEFNNLLKGPTASIGDVRIQLFNNGNFISATLFKIVLKDISSNQLAYLNELEATFGYELLSTQTLQPNSLLISNSTLIINRNLEGDFSFEVRKERETSKVSSYTEIIEILNRMEKTLELKIFRNLTIFSAVNTNVAFFDNKSGKTWWFNNGEFLLENLQDRLLVQSSANLVYGDGINSRGLLKLVKLRGEKQAQISANIDNIKINELAEQFPEFNFLSNFNLPVSISTTATLLDDGKLEGLKGVLETDKGEIILPHSNENFLVNNGKVYFEYDRSSNEVEVIQASIDTEFGVSTGAGTLYLNEKSDLQELIVTGQFELNDTKLYASKVFDQDFEIEKLITDIRMDFNNNSIEFGQFFAQFPEFGVTGTGKLKFSREGITAHTQFDISDLPFETFVNLWPLKKGMKSKLWAAKNINKGYLKNISGEILTNPTKGQNIQISFKFDDAVFKLLEGLGPIIEANGYGAVVNNTFSIGLESGYISSEYDDLMDISGSTLIIKKDDNLTPTVFINMISVANLPTSFRILEALPKKYQIPEKLLSLNLKGIALANTKLSFPLENKLKNRRISFSTSATLKSVSSNRIIAGQDFLAQTLYLEADNKNLSVKGEVNVGKHSIVGNWKKSFEPNKVGESKLEGKVTITNSLLSDLGVKLPDLTFLGKTTGDFSMIFKDGSPPVFRLKSDLKGLGIDLKTISWKKPEELLGVLQLAGNLGSSPQISNLFFSASDLSIDAKLFFKENGDLKKMICSSLIVQDWLDVFLEVSNNNENDFSVKILGGNLDLNKIKVKNKTDLLNYPIFVELDNLTISDDIILNNLTADLFLGQADIGNFTAKLNNGPWIGGVLNSSENGVAIKIESDDAGEVLRSSGMFENARNGELSLYLIPSGTEGHYDGELIVKNTRVVNAPVLAELLSAVSVIGLLEQMDGQGLAFTESKASFSFEPGVIQIHDSSAIGASMGLTMMGYFYPNTGAIKVNGVITPLYAVNGIFEQTGLFAGLLGKKKGEGVFGFNYELSSDGNKLLVDVNPLSILTPGVFRELFNSSMPERTE